VLFSDGHVYSNDFSGCIYGNISGTEISVDLVKILHFFKYFKNVILLLSRAAMAIPDEGNP
jgi:hypothetical protein